jgi:hypothetical protein
VAGGLSAAELAAAQDARLRFAESFPQATNIEQFNDELDLILRTLRRCLIALDVPLRTTEHESGPEQREYFRIY